MTTRRAFAAGLASLALLAAGMGAAAPAHAAGATLVITSPTESSVVSGVVTVTVTGTPEADGIINGFRLDTPFQAQIFQCPGVPGAGCVATFVWDTLGLPDGVKTIRAGMYYGPPASEVLIRTPLRTVTVANEPSVVEITGVTDGQIVSGPTQLTLSGVIPDSVDAHAGYFSLYGGTEHIANVPCPVSDTAKSCTVPYTWKPAWAGPLPLRADFIVISNATGAGRSTLSPPVTPLISSSTQIWMTAPIALEAGQRGVFRGSVEANGNLHRIVGLKVKLTLTRAVGSPIYLSARTNANGFFEIPWTFRSNTTMKAEVVPESWWRASSVTMVTKVRAKYACSVAATTVRRGRQAVGLCRTPNLPVGTLVRLQYLDSRTGRMEWTSIGIGRVAQTGLVPFAFTSSAPGTVKIRVLASASRVYTISPGPTLKITFT